MIGILTDKNQIHLGHREIAHFLGQDTLQEELSQMKTIRESGNRDRSLAGTGNSLSLRPSLDSKKPGYEKQQIFRT